MNILMKLKNSKVLSNNEKIIADYILEHPDRILKMTAKDLSTVCYVSTATIYRLCDKLELSGFADLKLKITSSLEEYLKSTENFDFNFPVKQFQTHYEIIHKLKEDYEQTLSSTANLFSLDQLKRVVSKMKKAQVIDVYTSAGNIYFAQNFQFQMQEIGVSINVPIDEYQQRLQAASSDNSHLAIIVSYSGRGIISDILFRILKERKTPIILISSYNYPIKEVKPDHHLYISSGENHYKKISSFSTRLSILYIFDILYTCYFELNYEENLERKLDYYRLIDKTNIR